MHGPIHNDSQIDLRHLTRAGASSGFGSGRLDRQAKSMCSLAGFLKGAGCLLGKEPVSRVQLDGVASVAESEITC
jgi:hypothetical protein